jgi:hypothetical protein
VIVDRWENGRGGGWSSRYLCADHAAALGLTLEGVAFLANVGDDPPPLAASLPAVDRDRPGSAVIPAHAPRPARNVEQTFDGDVGGFRG